MKFSFPVVAAALAACFLTTTAFGEQIDNPAYVSWAKYKPGTSVTMKQSTEFKAMQGMKNETTLTQKLLEVTPEGVVVEVNTKISVMGQQQENTAKRTIPAKVEKGTEAVPQLAEGMKPEIKDMKEGKETVDVNGKKVDAQTREFTMTMEMPGGRGPGGPMTMHTKTWSSPEVPGAMIKMEQTGTVAQMGDMTTTMALVDFTVVK